MERITDRAGDAPIAKKAAVAVAKSYENRRKFNGAYHKWSEVSSLWPTGPLGKDALLGMARCKHAAYIGPRYDASNLVSAKSYYENFRVRHPGDAAKIDVDGRLKQINEQLAYKQFSIGRYYQKTGNEQSANLYYRMVLRNWPDSTAAKMAKTAMDAGKSSDKKGKNGKRMP
jgi:outer membrane protein assembly factor BamD